MDFDTNGLKEFFRTKVNELMFHQLIDTMGKSHAKKAFCILLLKLFLPFSQNKLMKRNHCHLIELM